MRFFPISRETVAIACGSFRGPGRERVHGLIGTRLTPYERRGGRRCAWWSMVERIDRLTDEQVARFPEWVDKWTRIGLSCEPADWETFEHAVAQCYRFARLEPPKVIVRVASPIVVALAGPIALALMRRGETVDSDVLSAVNSAVRSALYSAVDSAVRSALYSAVYSAVDSAVRSALYSAVGSAVGSAVRSAVYSDVDSSVYSAVYSDVDSSVGSAVNSAVYSAVGSAVGSDVFAAVRSDVYSDVDSSVYSAVNSAVRAAVRSKWTNYIGGHLWCAWQAFESFFDEVCGLEHSKLAEARAYRSAQQSVGWWWPHSDFVLVSDRPKSLHITDNRLHCETGMAAEWRDGWGLWMIDGVRVDEQIVMRPETQTIAQIETCANEEVKRVRIERFGWDRYLRESGSEVVDERFNERDQQAERLHVTKDGIRRVVVSDPSTGRRYALGVPREVANCEQAQNFLSHGLDRRAIHRS